MFKRRSPQVEATGQAPLVTFLWSTLWVLIKIGLQDLPALPFAGLRYTLAFFCLLPFALRAGQLSSLRRLSAGMWARLVALGLLFYSVTQGAQFPSLVYLPTGGAIGLLVASGGVLANALSSILGRHVNRSAELEPLTVTIVSMGIGAVALMVGGIAVQGMPRLTLTYRAMILWLAAVNTAFAFTLWNRTLRTLSAMESSIINNTMLFQIAVLAWLFLDEALNWRQVLGMVLAVLGTLVVQVRDKASLTKL